MKIVLFVLLFVLAVAMPQGYSADKEMYYPSLGETLTAEAYATVMAQLAEDEATMDKQYGDLINAFAETVLADLNAIKKELGMVEQDAESMKQAIKDTAMAKQVAPVVVIEKELVK